MPAREAQVARPALPAREGPRGGEDRDTEPGCGQLWTPRVSKGPRESEFIQTKIKRVGNTTRRGSPRSLRTHAPSSWLQPPPTSHRPDSLQGPWSRHTLQETLHMASDQSPPQPRGPPATLL